MIFKMLFDKLQSNRVASNASWIIGCKLCKAFLTVISTMIMSRYLGVEKYGIINYVASLFTFVAPIMQLGINEILVHEIVVSSEDEGSTIGTTIALNVCSGVLCIIGVIAFVSMANANETDTILVCVCYSSILLFQAVEMVFYWFQAKLKAKYTSIAILLSYIAVLAIRVILVVSRASVYVFAITYAIEYLLIALILLFLYRREGGQRLTVSLAKAKHLLNSGKYYILSGLAVMLFSQTDKIMLKFMCDAENVGIYSAAAYCAGMTSFVFVAIIDSFRPVIFGSKNDRSLFEKRMVSLYSVIIWFSLVQCVLITLAAPLIIYVLYGAEYAGAADVLRVVVWFTTFSHVGTVRNVWILSSGHQKYLVWINLLGAIMNVFLNALLIPGYGAIGAAVASVITQFFTNFIVGYLIQPLRPNNALIVKGFHPKAIISVIRNE